MLEEPPGGGRPVMPEGVRASPLGKVGVKRCYSGAGVGALIDGEGCAKE